MAKTYDRSFPGVTVRAELEEALRSFRAKGLILEYSLARDTLELTRPWVEGETALEKFAGLAASARLDASRVVFARGCAELGPLHAAGHGHGALHPGNMVVASDGLRFLDPMFNRRRLCPQELEPGGAWLWATGIFEHLSLEKWDRVSLLRTTTLLARGPSVWSHPPADEEMVELCREWAARIVEALGEGADDRPKIEQAVACLEGILEYASAPVPAAAPPALDLDRELDAGLERAADRLLRRDAEEELRRRALEAGVPESELEASLGAWLLLNGVRREGEIETFARELLAEGVIPESSMVKAGACVTAERAFTFYGVAPEEAADRVRTLLASRGWTDEREVARRCRERLSLGGDRPGGRLIPDGEIDEVVSAIAEEEGLPKSVANRLVRMEVERGVLQPRSE